jgi:hypothetical protein
MVRVCCNKGCKRLFGTYGCKSSLYEAFYCDDCELDRPDIYRNCTVRRTKPSPYDSTHGICRECMKEILAGVAGFQNDGCRANIAKVHNL